MHKRFKIRRFGRLPIILGITTPILTLAALATAHFTIPREAQAAGAQVTIQCFAGPAVIGSWSSCPAEGLQYFNAGQANPSNSGTSFIGRHIRINISGLTTGQSNNFTVTAPYWITIGNLGSISGLNGTRELGASATRNPSLTNEREGYIVVSPNGHNYFAPTSIRVTQSAGSCASAFLDRGWGTPPGNRCVMRTDTNQLVRNATNDNRETINLSNGSHTIPFALWHGTNRDGQLSAVTGQCADGFTVNAQSVTVQPNRGSLTRSCLIAVGNDGGSFVISQAGGFTPSMSMRVTNNAAIPVMASAANSSIEFRVQVSTNGGANWFTPTANSLSVAVAGTVGGVGWSPLTAEHVNTNLIRVTSGSARGVPAPREARIAVTWTNPDHPSETHVQEFIVRQQGTSNNTLQLMSGEDVVETVTFESSSSNQNFTLRFGDGEEYVNVLPNPAPQINTSPQDGEWLFVNTNTFNNTISISASSNGTSGSRTGTITFRYNNIPTTVTVTQLGLFQEGGGEGDNAAIEVTCDLGPLGWALCPLIEGTDSILGSIYGVIEDNFLRINLGLYANLTPSGEETGIFRAWRYFRDFANIFFVIFFLVVIFSQITSVGISNYGIKKMLPEIIMAAILINLSFFIAQAMVDLSNIIGFQIHSLLVGFARDIIASGGGVLEAPDFSNGLLAGLVGALGLAAAGVTIALVLTQGFGALLAVALVFLISAAVAVIMIFVLLVVRQVGIIILIVLSPLAFAARILPGTQGLFRKWWSMFVSLLVVYPACGLVIGAGMLAGTIIFQASSDIDSQFMAVVAMMATIAPYFAVITIIKGSLGGLGKVGAFITGAAVGAGAVASRQAARGVHAGGKFIGDKSGYTAGKDARLNAKAATAKAKADEKAAILAAGGSVGLLSGGMRTKKRVDQMQKAEFHAAQHRDEAALASVGEYGGTDKKKLGISRENAVDLGLYKEGNATYARDKAAIDAESNIKKKQEMQAKLNDKVAKSNRNAATIAANPTEHVYAIEQQGRAATAVQVEQKKQSEKVGARYADMGMEDVYGEVMEKDASGKYTGRLSANASDIDTEQAIKKMADKGEWKKLGQIQNAYMSRGIDRSGQRRTADILTRHPDVKDQAFQYHVLGKQLESDAELGGAMSYGNTNDFFNSADFRSKIEGGKYDKQIASAHGESAEMLAAADSAAGGTQLRETIGGRVSGAAAGGISESTIDKYVGSDNAIQASTMFHRAVEDYNNAGQNAAGWGYSAEKRAKLAISNQPQGRPVPSTSASTNTNAPPVPSGWTQHPSGIVTPPSRNNRPPSKP